jgi:hypothetical protein
MERTKDNGNDVDVTVDGETIRADWVFDSVTTRPQASPADARLAFTGWVVDYPQPRLAFGPRDLHAALPLRDFALGTGAPTTTVTFEPDPTLILLFTTGDAPAHWLRAGAALQRVLLTATLRGLAATPLSQLLEVPKLRALLADSITGEVVQTVLRIGYPTTLAPATPRRAIEDVIVTTSDDSSPP